MPSHPFERYLTKHGHYPRLRIDNGSQGLQVTFAPGYVKIETFPRGGQVYITRSAFVRLIRRSVPLAKKMGRDFDVPAAMARDAEEEAILQKEFRAQKRERRGPRRKRRT